MRYLYKVRWWMKFYSRHLIWRISTRKKEVFITFDDGPHPTITPWVLAVLKEYDAKASFFCVGKNVDINPDVFKQIIQEGHVVGNHTYEHEIGWKTSVEKYLMSVNRCESVFGTPFFRPPHGRINHRQINALKDKFQIVMWSLMSGDFDPSLSPNGMLSYLQENVTKGDIIVFHDSEKAIENLKIILPKFLEFLKQNNYQCSVLRSDKAHTFS